jgi:hypothetical protein
MPQKRRALDAWATRLLEIVGDLEPADYVVSSTHPNNIYSFVEVGSTPWIATLESMICLTFVFLLLFSCTELAGDISGVAIYIGDGDTFIIPAGQSA